MGKKPEENGSSGVGTANTRRKKGEGSKGASAGNISKKGTEEGRLPSRDFMKEKVQARKRLLMVDGGVTVIEKSLHGETKRDSKENAKKGGSRTQ